MDQHSTDLSALMPPAGDPLLRLRRLAGALILMGGAVGLLIHGSRLLL